MRLCYDQNPHYLTNACLGLSLKHHLHGIPPVVWDGGVVAVGRRGTVPPLLGTDQL